MSEIFRGHNPPTSKLSPDFSHQCSGTSCLCTWALSLAPASFPPPKKNKFGLTPLTTQKASDCKICEWTAVGYINCCRCTNCFAPRPTDPFARFCNECGGAVPPLPQSRIPPPAAGQVSTMSSVNSVYFSSSYSRHFLYGTYLWKLSWYSDAPEAKKSVFLPPTITDMVIGIRANFF